MNLELEEIKNVLRTSTQQIDELKKSKQKNLDYAYSMMLNRMNETQDVNEREKLMLYFFNSVMCYDEKLSIFYSGKDSDLLEFDKFDTEYCFEESMCDYMPKTVAFDFKNMLYLVGDIHNDVEKIPQNYSQFRLPFEYYNF